MSPSEKLLPRIGLTVGDSNGIGPEVIVKTLRDPRILGLCTPVVFGSSRLMAYYKKALDEPGFSYTTLRADMDPNPKQVNVVNCWEDESLIEPGNPTRQSGQHAASAIMAAADALSRGDIQALVTAPIHKSNLPQDRFPFPGHTEYFSQYFQVRNSVMLLVSGELRVGLVTNHLPISQVAAAITPELVFAKLRVLYRSLQHDFGISKPKIALLGLNPHAGNEGLFGDEEARCITPAIQDAQDKKALVFGPFPADSFFGSGKHKAFDAVLAMYHDQGLIPFKTLAFGSGVNYTAGLPVVRTSPDHGTAFDIAGKNEADPDSLRAALFLALDIARNRALHGLPEPA
jgi:4-hydroxythreonine-4-phosphate dehydrogenase